MPASSVEYDLRIQRHQVVKAAEENGWGRQAAPNFDYFRRGGDKSVTEVQVFYLDNGAVNSARIIDHTNGTCVRAARPTYLGFDRSVYDCSRLGLPDRLALTGNGASCPVFPITV